MAISKIQKLNSIAAQQGIDAFIITSAASVKYFSGYFFYFEYGASPFHLLPAALFAVPGYKAVLLMADNEVHQAEHVYEGISIQQYASYTYTTQLVFAQQFITVLQGIIQQHLPGIKRIGIEANSLPCAIAQSLTGTFGNIEFTDVSAPIAKLKAIKEADEILCIRQAAQLSDIAQQSVVKHARPGITELQLFNLIRNDIEAEAGSRIPLMADLSSGANTAAGGGMPTNKIIEEGDVIISDFTPCLQGYWGDSCASICVGKPTAEQRSDFALLQQALSAGIAAIRPGVKALEIDRVMRSIAGNFPHHGGHGVGTMYHEEPGIVPYNTTTLLPGMVIALEPAIYKPDFGMRLEHLLLVTEQGNEVLTKYQHRLEQ